MKIRLLVNSRLHGRVGRVIDTPYEGWANLMIKRKKAELVEDEVKKPRRQRRTEKAVTHG